MTYTARWKFDDDKMGQLPAGWRAAQTGPGAPATWTIVEGNLANPAAGKKASLMAPKDGADAMNLLLAEGTKAQDFWALKVDVQLVGAGGERRTGIVWRAQDEKNFYLAEWSAAQNQVSVQVVRDGQRTTIATAKVAADPATWHQFEIKHVDDRIMVEFDEENLIVVEDPTFPGAGAVGVCGVGYTSAHFDDMRLNANLMPWYRPADPVATTPAVAKSFPLKLPAGRIAISSDGNQHDEDDWGATAMTLAIIDAVGLNRKLVHYDFASHVGDNGVKNEGQMIESALGGAGRFNLDKARFFNDQSQLAEAIGNFRREGNQSSAADPLWFICAGPMEVPWRMINAVDPAKRPFIHCISHSEWNDKHGDTPEMTHQWEDLGKLGATLHHIADQNKSGRDDYDGFNVHTKKWSWLKTSSNPNAQWLYRRNYKTLFDISDTGMIFWLITGGLDGGSEKGGASDVRYLLENPVKKAAPGDAHVAASSAGAAVHKIVVLPPQKNVVMTPAPLDFAVEQKYRALRAYDARWGFAPDQAGPLPKGWTVAQTNPGTPVKWQIIEEKDNTGKGTKAVALIESKNTGNVFNLLLADGLQAKDLTLQADLKVLGGAEDPGGGLVWRARDPNNYYLARWNHREKNFRVYAVVEGKRKQLGSAKLEADPALWHEVSIKHVGSLIRVEFDRARLLSLVDGTYAAAGQFGLYAKADSTTAFSDIRLMRPREGVVLSDPLNGSTVGRQTGGQFVSGGGWTVKGDGERIIWDLPPMPANGRFEIDIRNFNPPQQVTGAHNVFLGLWATLFTSRDKVADAADRVDADNYEIRMGTAWGTKFKLEIHATGKAEVLVWEPFKVYDPARTYHYKIEWRDGKVTTWLDDRELVFAGKVYPHPGVLIPEGADEPVPAAAQVDGEPVVFDNLNFAHIGTAPYFNGPGTAGPIYSNLKITALGESK